MWLCYLLSLFQNNIRNIFLYFIFRNSFFPFFGLFRATLFLGLLSFTIFSLILPFFYLDFFFNFIFFIWFFWFIINLIIFLIIIYFILMSFISLGLRIKFCNLLLILKNEIPFLFKFCFFVTILILRNYSFHKRLLVNRCFRLFLLRGARNFLNWKFTDYLTHVDF